MLPVSGINAIKSRRRRVAMQVLDPPPQLNELTWQEAGDLLRLRPVGLLPVGAIEPHGPHLPLDTDVIIAKGISRYTGSALRRSGIPALILPPVQYTVSFVGASFPGAMPIDHEVFTDYLTSLLRYSISSGYRAICLCNAHLEPAHVEAIERALVRMRGGFNVPLVFPDKRSPEIARLLGEEFSGGARHAGAYETSIVMAEANHCVRRTELEELQPVWIDLPRALSLGARDFMEAGSDLGYFGDPAAASPEEGVRILEILGEMIHDHVMHFGSRIDLNQFYIR
jgi:creatinine amidohydrolase